MKLPSLRRVFACLAAAIPLLSTQARVLDDFDDNTKTGWEDFTFQAGFGIPSEQSGQFRFTQPPAGQAIFSASQKKSEVFDLREGRTIEYRIDVEETGGKDSFAVLAFIPTGNSPGTLAGYGFAKSTTDVLITKGINRYFVADSWPAEGKNDRITLSLTLAARGGNVEVTARVLDKDAGNAVVWERTVIDTPSADVLADGDDEPAAPFVTGGYFTLYCYQDFDAGAPENPYKVFYDNAEVFVTDSSVVDNFDDNTKTDWEDFTFLAGFGIPSEQAGQFRFTQPPAGQAIFSASQKKSRVFDLVDGERLEFAVDVEETGGKDSFAVLAFIPTGNSPGTLAGYGFAKSTTDVLITKGINRYFVADGWPAEGKNERITMVLTLTARGGGVEIRARVLDRDADNAVVWERTVFDTTAADVMADGDDEPAAPFLTGGYFTLYCYQDFDAGAPENPYKVFYDNAVVAAPPAGDNAAPILGDILPAQGANFLAASTRVSFRATDDKDLPASGLAIVLNGTRHDAGSGLTVTGTGNALTASLGGLEANRDYTAQLIAVDSDGAGVTNIVYFDTFLTGNVVIESEDYNFLGGSFIDNPVPTTEGGFAFNAYAYQAGTSAVDFSDTRTAPNFVNTPWRPDDPIRMQRTLDIRRAKYDAAGGAGNVNQVFDYDVGDIVAGEWLNYTRTFPPGTYEVYLRQSIANMENADSVLEEVTSDRTVENQTVRLLGTFLGRKSGFEYRNTPLTDGAGVNRTVLTLSGVTTLRVRQITSNAADGSRYQNYLVFVPVAPSGPQRATVTAISPAPNSATQTARPEITVTIENRDTSVKPETIRLTVNGTEVTPTVTPTATGATVAYPLAVLPPSGQSNTARLVFRDSEDQEVSSQWSFVINYRTVRAEDRIPGTGSEAGLRVRVVQASFDVQPLANDLQRAEDQLAPNSAIAKAYDTTVVAPVINYSQEAPIGGTSGFFADDTAIPGQSDEFGTDDWAMEILTYLDLPAGVVRFGVNCDDGYKIASAPNPTPTSANLAFRNGAPANETFDVVVPVAGLYRFRMVWYERGGGAHVEWFTVDPSTGDRTLINAPGGIRAYTTVTAPSVGLSGAATLSGPFQPEAGVQVDTGARTLTVTRSGDVRFYQVTGAAGVRASRIEVTGDQVVVHYTE